MAGAVFAAAVILDPDRPIAGLADSKKLSEKRLDALAIQIKAHALAWAVCSSSVEEIDQINILQASLLAMRRAIDKMRQQFGIAPDLVQIDGNKTPDIDLPCEAIIQGDSKVEAISAASILAKTARDAELYDLDAKYPQYGFARHKGYPTPYHLEMLSLYGVSCIHRRSYAPVRKILESGGAI